MRASILSVAAASLLFFDAACGAGFYPRGSEVLNLDARSYRNLIAKSNYTSIVEFYAPWCGHCQNLKPAYEKAAKNLKGLAKVAAVNCDEDANKPFCGDMGVQGFPTLKIVRPSKKVGKPTVEDYQGPRTAKGIVDSVVDKIPNHVKRLQEKDLDEFLQTDKHKAKALLFTDKGATSALLRAIAIDYLGSIDVGQVRSKEKGALEKFDVTTFPTLVLIPSSDSDPITYSGAMKKDDILEFLAQVGPPNPEFAPSGKSASSKPSKASSGDKKKASKDSAAFSKASASHQSAEAKTGKASAAASESIEDDSPTASPHPDLHESDSKKDKPVPIPSVPSPLPSLDTSTTLRSACLQSDSPICFLVVLPLVTPSPSAGDPDLVNEHDDTQQPLHDASAALPAPAQQAVDSLTDIAHRNKHIKIYAVPASNPLAWNMRELLQLGDQADPLPEILATNAKRSWYKRFRGDALTVPAVENWVDAVRMGEGKKLDLPDALVGAGDDGAGAEAAAAAAASAAAEAVGAERAKGEPIEVNLGDLPEGLEVEFEELPDDQEHDEL